MSQDSRTKIRELIQCHLSVFIKTIGCIMLMLFTYVIHAQQLDTFNYSYLKFGDVYEFYQSKDINIVAAENPDLYFEVFSWLNTPYHWGGKSQDGIDCSAFTAVVCNKIYYTLLGGAVGDIFKHCTEIQPTDLVEGDLVFFNIKGKYLSHVGIYLQNDQFVHAAVHGGVIVSSLKEAYYKHWFYKAARLHEE